MSDAPVIWTVDARGVARVALNRPGVGNAYDGSMVEGLHDAMDALARENDLRAVLLTGRGRHFQGGADLNWLNAVRVDTAERNHHASRRTADAVDRLNRLPVPTVALIQGYCIGGGTGLVAACDVALASETAQFAISEARWGLTAAIIIPQLADAIGARQIRRYALTGERFSAAEARRIGLVHDVVPEADLQAAGDRIIDALLENAPGALAETKALALRYAFGAADPAAMASLVSSHAMRRMSEEAAEGLASFKEKRPGRW